MSPSNFDARLARFTCLVHVLHKQTAQEILRTCPVSMHRAGPVAAKRPQTQGAIS